MIRISITPENARTPDELHSFFYEKLELPPYYGRNLDALYDALTERSQLTCIVIENSAAQKAVLGDYYDRLICVLTDAQADSDGRLRLLIK